MLILTRGVSCALLCVALNACSAPLCDDVAVGKSAAGLELTVSGKPLKRIGKEFFGFNLESTEFQLSLWDPKTRQVRPEVMRVLKEFDGAVYRFPGGTTANYYRWAQGVGPVDKREPARIADWIELPRIDFGTAEYLDFVRSVGGQAWFVLNLQGSLGKLEDAAMLENEAKDLVRYLRERRQAVLRWELGNELDRAHDMWPFAQYLSRASGMLAAVREVDPEARFVGMMADYDAQAARGVSASDYNQAVVRGLAPHGVKAYEQHLYYDGPPDGPSIPNRLGQLCRSIKNALDHGVAANQLQFWVTEHARWPQADEGRPWKEAWRKSSDLGAAIGIADLLIALTQVPSVQGSAVHSLHGTGGPWPMFHRQPGKDGRTYEPSVTMHAYAMLQRTMLPLVLPTRSASSNRVGYAGGYAGRGAVMTNSQRDRYSAWSVNREPEPITVALKIPDLAGRTVPARLEYLTSQSTSAHNYDDPHNVLPQAQARSLEFDSHGAASYVVPAHSVSTLMMAIAR